MTLKAVVVFVAAVIVCVAVIGSLASPTVDETLRGTKVRSDVKDKFGRTDNFKLASGEIKIKNDGQYALSSANGLLWHDVNGNGQPDEAELAAIGFAKEVIRLYHLNGTLAETNATRTDGRFSFIVDPGKYYILADCPAGFKHSPSFFSPSLTSDLDLNRSPEFEIEASKAHTGLNWGCYKPPSVAGTVFQDSNIDGVQQPDEDGVPNVEVRLTMASDSSFVATQRTDRAGKFSFSNLRPGDFSLHFIIPADTRYQPPVGTLNRFHFSTNPDGSRRLGSRSLSMGKIAVTKELAGSSEMDLGLYFSLLSGDNAIVDLGIYALAQVVGRVFEDTNANGVQDLDEKALPDVEVTLYRTPQEYVASQKSDHLGDYHFKDLEPGEYYVSFDLASPDYKHSVGKKVREEL